MENEHYCWVDVVVEQQSSDSQCISVIPVRREFGLNTNVRDG